MVAQRFYLIRHGESQSQSGESSDFVNPDLSQRGVLQAKRLAPLLRDCHPDLIVISPMQRAWKTFLHSEKKAPRQRFDSRLVESYLPHHYEAGAPFPTADCAQADQANAYGWTAGERADSIWAELRASPYKDIMFFCHWGVCGDLLRAALGIGASNRPCYSQMDNAALSVIEIDDADKTTFFGNPTIGSKSCLRIWNHTEHLKGLLPADETLGFLHR